MEQDSRQHLVTDTGTRDSLTWEFSGIRMGHALSRFQSLATFRATSAMTDVVRLHIGLRGNYSFCSRAAHDKPAYIRNPTDLEKLSAVRDLILERLTSPPNLSQIARTVGLNEYKLKRGFKEVFQTTVFGYLAEQRLLLARQYLLDTRKTAAEIAAELGYATPQHFNNAFKKRFGVPPDNFRNGPGSFRNATQKPRKNP